LEQKIFLVTGWWSARVMASFISFDQKISEAESGAN
jgi:hypothetical protein